MQRYEIWTCQAGKDVGGVKAVKGEGGKRDGLRQIEACARKRMTEGRTDGEGDAQVRRRERQRVKKSKREKENREACREAGRCWILWNTPTFSASIKVSMMRFRLKRCRG